MATRSFFARLADDARYAFDNLSEVASDLAVPTVKLGVTGLARSGKTVFITALVHNLIHGGRLPLFAAAASGRIAGADLQPQPDDDVPRFDVEAHVAALIDERIWPQSTRQVSELRLTIDYESASLLNRTFGRGKLHLDIIDYPGEWLLDLPLLNKSYAEFSVDALAAARTPIRKKIASSLSRGTRKSRSGGGSAGKRCPRPCQHIHGLSRCLPVGRSRVFDAASRPLFDAGRP